MRIKRTVLTSKVGLEIGYAIGIAESIYRKQGEQLVVTSLNDSKHHQGSLHYAGMAVDLRTRNLSAVKLLTVFDELRALLEPQGFDVVQETDHIHIEFQPKPSESFYQYVD